MEREPKEKREGFEEYQEPTLEEINQMIQEGLEDIVQGRIVEITSAKDLLEEQL